MDPEVTLAQLRAWAKAAIAQTLDDQSHREIMAAEQFTALDSWLVSGGFRPQAWAWAPFPASNSVNGVTYGELCHELGFGEDWEAFLTWANLYHNHVATVGYGQLALPRDAEIIREAFKAGGHHE